jgi:hypothetical protein
MVDTLTGLEAAAEITRVKARYVRALEERDWDLYADCLTESVTASFAPPPGRTEAVVHRGRDHLREWISTALAGTHVVTRVSTPDIEVIDADHARGTWALVERLIPLEGPDRERVYYGHYHETYKRCEDGRWRIATIRISRVRYDIVGDDGMVRSHLDPR